jgi:hypothetical protein
MKKSMVGWRLLALGLLFISLSGKIKISGDKPEPDYGNIPLFFIPNRGQTKPETLFYAKASGYTLWMTKQSLVFDAAGKEADSERDLSSLVFLNANNDVELEPSQPAECRVSYFIGDDPSQWRTDIPTSYAVLYKNIYRNIDLKVHGLERQIEYDWIIKPGGRPDSVRFKYGGLEGARVDDKGDLIVKGSFGELRHRKPAAYQIIDGKRVEVETAFKRTGRDEYGFGVKDFDPAVDLIIDPVVLVYSSYLGGSGTDYFGESYWQIIGGIAVDGQGAAYITGETDSTNFPAKTAYQKTSGGTRDIFIAKLSPDGKSLVYSSYLGGFSNDGGESIAVDSEGAAYVTGWTFSSNFPVKKAFQSSNRGGADGFVAKLAPSGQSLDYSTLLGGNSSDICHALAIDSDGAAYVTGETLSADFPIKAAYQKKIRGKHDAFVTKLAPTGQMLVYSSFLGGAENDVGLGITVDGRKLAYVTGSTDSKNFPVKNAYQKALGLYGSDAFVAKLAANGKGLIFSTYLGGQNTDYAYSIAVDNSGAACLTGTTGSYDFPTQTPFQKAYGGHADAFVAKLAPTGQALEYSTFLGGTGEDFGGGLAVDVTGAVWVTGGTASKDFPVKNAYQKTNRGKYDLFVANLSPAGKGLISSTYLGGADDDYGVKIVLDGGGAAYLTGGTRSRNFPTKKAFQKTNRGGFDAFILKVSAASKSAKPGDAR